MTLVVCGWFASNGFHYVFKLWFSMVSIKRRLVTNGVMMLNTNQQAALL